MWNVLLILFSFIFEFGNDSVDNVGKKKMTTCSSPVLL